MDSELYFTVHDYFKNGLGEKLRENESLFYFLFKETNENLYYELNTIKDDESNRFIIKFRNQPDENFLDIGYINLELNHFEQISNGSELVLDFKLTPISSFSSLFKSMGGLQKSYEKSKKVSQVINHFFEYHFIKMNSDKNNFYNSYYKCFINKDKKKIYDREVILLIGENILKGTYRHMTKINLLNNKDIIFELNKTIISKTYSMLDKKSLEKEINDVELNKLIQSEIIYFLTNDLTHNIDELASMSYNINNILQEKE